MLFYFEMEDNEAATCWFVSWNVVYITQAALRLSHKPHSAPPNDVAKLRVRGVHSLYLSPVRPPPRYPRHPQSHSHSHPLIDRPTCPLTTTSTKTLAMRNSYRLKKTLAVPLTDVLLQTIRSRDMRPPRKQTSRVAIRSARVCR